MYTVPTASHEYKPGSSYQPVEGANFLSYFPFSAQPIRPGRLAASLAGPAIVVGSPAWYKSLGGGFGLDPDDPANAIPSWGTAGRVLTLPRAFVGRPSPALAAWLNQRGVLVYQPIASGGPQWYVPAASYGFENRLVRLDGTAEVQLPKPRAVPVKWMGGDLYIHAPSELREAGQSANGDSTLTVSYVIDKDTCGEANNVPPATFTTHWPPPPAQTQGYRRRVKSAAAEVHTDYESTCHLYSSRELDPARPGFYKVCELCSHPHVDGYDPEFYDFWPESASKPMYDLLHALYTPACRKFRVAGDAEYDFEGADYHGADVEGDVMAFFGG